MKLNIFFIFIKILFSFKSSRLFQLWNKLFDFFLIFKLYNLFQRLKFFWLKLWILNLLIWNKIIIIFINGLITISLSTLAILRCTVQKFFIWFIFVKWRESEVFQHFICLINFFILIEIWLGLRIFLNAVILKYCEWNWYFMIWKRRLLLF